MSDLTPFEFGGHSMRFGLTEDGTPYVVAADMAKALGYRSGPDLARIVADDEKGSQLVRTPGGDQRMTVLYEYGIYEAIFLSRRDEAVAFKTRVKDILREIRVSGGYLSPTATADQLENLARKAAVLRALDGIVDRGFLDAKGRILAAQALGETPELDQSTKPLTVSIYLSRKGLKGKEQKATASVFGKRLKALFVETYGEEPPQIEDVVGRHVVNVAQYQEQHSRLFDQVWTKYYGGAA